MENKIIETVTSIFNGADERNWQKVHHAFAPEVLLDYASMNGNPATVMSAEQIIEAWKGFLPGFDKTHHQVSDFKIDQRGAIAEIHFVGKADHFIGSDKWTVAGTYDLEAIQSGNKWKVSKFKFNFEKQNGNTELPQKAVETIKSTK
jgi:hypothetical protein